MRILNARHCIRPIFVSVFATCNTDIVSRVFNCKVYFYINIISRHGLIERFLNSNATSLYMFMR